MPTKKSTKKPATRKAPAKKAASKPAVGERLSRTIGQAFDGHGADVWGLACIVTGVVAALGVYGDFAGPVGDGLDWLAGAGVGVAKYVLPPALLAVGVVLVKGPARRDDDERSRRGDRAGSDTTDQLVRLAVGSLLVSVSVTALLHIVRGRPAWGDGIDEVADAGGALGYAVGHPLATVLAPVGGFLVALVVGVIGVLVLTRGRLRTAATVIATWARRTIDSLVRAWETGEDGADPVPMTVSAPQPEPAPDPEPEPPAAETPAKPRKPRKAKVKVPDVGDDGEQLEMQLGAAANGSQWRLPSLSLLERSDDQEIDEAEVAESGRVLERALAEHGVETRLVGMVVGPTVTRYELELGPGVKVARVTSLNKDIAYAMASPDVRILAPIPGRQAIGVEVPNRHRATVALGDLLGSSEARKAKHPLEVAVGRDINGRTMMMNLAKMPHILIAGATGSGKSSCINSIITSILMRSTPDDVRLILVDPKMVEMTQYERVPHLLTEPVTDPKKAANALAWACREMDRRYELLSAVGFRDITGYNSAYDRGELAAGLGELDADGEPKQYKRLPMILVVVDELADLMMVAARDVEDSICRIAQKARAVGIHLVIATQRPSTNVITGVIKANVPARLAFAVSSLTDSRVILDQPGAERLVGQGDMLMVSANSSNAQRIQGAWVSEEEVRQVVGAWRNQELEIEEVPAVTTDSILEGGTDNGSPSGSGGGGGTGGDDDDELLSQAMELVVSSQLGSTSMLQRKLRVGFARAGRLMDLLEERGVVGPSTGSKAREVLISPEELGGDSSDESEPAA